MLVLVIGDAHIPERAAEIPAPISKLLVPGKFDEVVSVGNISDKASLEVISRLTTSAPIKRVAGADDLNDAKIPTSRVFRAGKFRIGVISSFLVVPAEDIDALSILARQLDVDILLWGGSHRQDTQKWANTYFLNPGSLTGSIHSWNSQNPVEPAGFSLLDVADDICTVYMYRQNGDGIKVEKAQLSYIPRN